MSGEKAVARLEPVEHSWEEQLGPLLPSKCLKHLPQGYVNIYKCAGNCALVDLFCWRCGA